MKKVEKIKILDECIASKKLARVFFTYDSNYYYFYPNIVNDKFLLAQEEDDFLLDGYHVRRISHIRKVEIKDDLCPAINEWNGVATQISKPHIDISSWKSLLSDLRDLGCFIIIEDDINEQFAMGRIEKTCTRYIVFRSLDADGIWQEDPLIIPYSTITHVAWNTRYSNNWEKYMASKAHDLTIL